MSAVLVPYITRLHCHINNVHHCLDLTMSHAPLHPPYPPPPPVTGMMSRTLTAPIERLRTVMMTSSAGSSGSSMRSACASIWADGGVRGEQSAVSL